MAEAAKTTRMVRIMICWLKEHKEKKNPFTVSLIVVLYTTYTCRYTSIYYPSQFML
jgi:hypothetical protein